MLFFQKESDIPEEQGTHTLICLDHFPEPKMHTKNKYINIRKQVKKYNM